MAKKSTAATHSEDVGGRVSAGWVLAPAPRFVLRTRDSSPRFVFSGVSKDPRLLCSHPQLAADARERLPQAWMVVPRGSAVAHYDVYEVVGRWQSEADFSAAALHALERDDPMLRYFCSYALGAEADEHDEEDATPVPAGALDPMVFGETDEVMGMGQDVLFGAVPDLEDPSVGEGGEFAAVTLGEEWPDEEAGALGALALGEDEEGEPVGSLSLPASAARVDDAPRETEDEEGEAWATSSPAFDAVYPGDLPALDDEDAARALLESGALSRQRRGVVDPGVDEWPDADFGAGAQSALGAGAQGAAPAGSAPSGWDLDPDEDAARREAGLGGGDAGASLLGLDWDIPHHGAPPAPARAGALAEPGPGHPRDVLSGEEVDRVAGAQVARSRAHENGVGDSALVPGGEFPDEAEAVREALSRGLSPWGEPGDDEEDPLGFRAWLGDRVRALGGWIRGGGPKAG